MAGSQTIGEASENPVGINVTAMVDVIFCLCIFFMCSFHFKQVEGKLESWLPKHKGVFAEAPGVVDDDILVLLAWDGARTTRKVLGSGPAASDEDLLREVLAIAAGHRRSGNERWAVVIDAAADVPWQEVVHVMDLCKRHGIERIELAAPGRAVSKLAGEVSGQDTGRAGAQGTR